MKGQIFTDGTTREFTFFDPKYRNIWIFIKNESPNPRLKEILRYSQYWWYQVGRGLTFGWKHYRTVFN